ncbi:hypothetical protein BGZ49_006289 [Haplosporangium sp. Z 27]|nr:hypothetical protein BGZ49_006289 [Haplosporangium sp. Z 27]
MKLLLKLSLAATLVSSAFAALTVKQFVDDPQIKALAPHLLEEIASQGVETFNQEPQDISKIKAGLKPPLLDDIAQIVSLNVFYGEDADWSKLETAKLKAIHEYGPEAFAAATNLQDVDIQRASILANTIYDTVVHLPPLSKESYNEIKTYIKKDAEEEPKAETTDNEAKPDSEPNPDSKTKADNKEADAKEKEKPTETVTASPLWDLLGFSLIKSSNTMRKAKGIVTPSNVCETTNTEYLKGVDDVVYYSSLTHGIAGGALLSAPAGSTVKSHDLEFVVLSFSKLAVSIQMAQSVARLAGLDPLEPQVRTLAFVALTADSASSPSALNARDIDNLIVHGVGTEIPGGVLKSLADQAALTLVTRGAGLNRPSPAIFNDVPIFRDVVAFSSEVLNANSVGDVLKFAFCPEPSHVTEPLKANVVVDEIKEKVGETAETVTDKAQKAFKPPKEAAQRAGENIKKAADEAGSKVGGAAASAKGKVQEAGTNFQNKVTEDTEKVNAAGEKLAEDVKNKADKAKLKVAEIVKDNAEKVAKKAGEKQEDIKQEL